CLDAGMDDHVAKPIRAHDLFAAVERFTPREKIGSGTGLADRESAAAGGHGAATADVAMATLPSADPARRKNMPASAASGAFDRQAALASVGGDVKLLRELIEIFLHDRPAWIDQLRLALEQGDAKQMGRVAHTLKNALGYFGAQATYELALELE